MITRKERTPMERRTEERARKDGASHSPPLSDEARWPTGAANLHQVVNRRGEPYAYLILGSRAATSDVTHYPDRGDVLSDLDDRSWRMKRADGAVIRERRRP